MKKTLISVAAILLSAVLCIGAAASGGAVTEPENDGEAILSAELPKHKTPTNLRWNEDSDGNPLTCSISWDSIPESGNKYKLEIYRDGVLVYNTNFSCSGNTSSRASHFSTNPIFTKSGKYTFKVAARGDNQNYQNSDFAQSGEFEYTVPQNKLPSITGLKWDKNGKLTHNGVEGANGYHYVKYYRAEGKDEIIPTGGTSGHSGGSEAQTNDFSQDILETVNNFDKVTDYYIKVYAIPKDLSKQTYSEGVLSPAYSVLHLRNFAGETARDILDNYDADSVDADEKKKELLDTMSKNNLAATELALAFVDDYNVENALFGLEIDYMNENNIRTTVSDSSNGYISGLGIDTEDIVVKGAALNAAKSNSTVNLKVSKPSEERSPSATFFTNCNAMALTLEGVSDSTSLDVPVLIYLPVPENYDVWSTVMLHYKKDGTYEILHGKQQYMNGGQYLAFCVTGFSDFVLCQTNRTNDLNYDGTINCKDVQHYMGEIMNGIERGYFGANMSGSLDLNGDGKFNFKDLNYLMGLFRENGAR